MIMVEVASDCWAKHSRTRSKLSIFWHFRFPASGIGPFGGGSTRAWNYPCNTPSPFISLQWGLDRISSSWDVPRSWRPVLKIDPRATTTAAANEGKRQGPKIQKPRRTLQLLQLPRIQRQQLPNRRRRYPKRQLETYHRQIRKKRNRSSITLKTTRNTRFLPASKIQDWKINSRLSKL